MTHVIEAITSRTSVNNYDRTHQLSDAEIGELIALATQAPSAFNGQNWKFIAVRSPEAKARLHPAAYGQQKVLDAAVTFIVCGKLGIQETLPAALASAKSVGILDDATYEGWVGAASNMYGPNPALQRDEAVRSASLAAMTLMLAAKGLDLGSCPMIGFDAGAVTEAFNLEPADVPVMLVTVGRAAVNNWAKKPRLAVSQVLSFA